ncbi:MAG: GNAT family N-acetyltransferase [Streptococcaceae bacterium]|jgi:ribosomal protein S18 acetylase RimI-like enzyme|nr:GNAT family N-acetyltransferase [Streptococcaceae bacterium]
MEIVVYRNTDEALYEQTLALRNALLRQPYGFSIYDEDLSYETGNYFFGALDESGELLGTVNYFVPEPGISQLCALAVRTDLQKQGIGRKLVSALFEDLQQKNFKKCIVEARESAVGFYEKTGFIIDAPIPNTRLGGIDWLMHRDLENI